jgi:SHS2 domain-containing protein
MHELFSHTADIGLRVKAPTLDELFADAALGLFTLIVGNIDSVKPAIEVPFALQGRTEEYDYLLFDWLSELLFIFDSRSLVLAKFNVYVDATGLHARAWGEPLDPAKHRLEHEVKAITYHGLKLERQADSWLAEVIVDI